MRAKMGSGTDPPRLIGVCRAECIADSSLDHRRKWLVASRGWHNYASMLHKKGKIAFDSFRGYEKYNSSVAYNNSKLCNVLFALELASRCSSSGVTSNVLHPGAVSTDIVRDLPWIVRKVIGMIFMSPEKGAETTVMLASDPSLEKETGNYYDQTKLENCSALGHDRELRKLLWDKSAELVNLSTAKGNDLR